MADRIEQIALKTEIGPDEQAFIESRDFFFLTTVDARAADVSYKGGAPGFVRVVDPTHLMFPSYDGNGMYCRWATSPPTPRSASCSSTSSGRSGCACRARRRCAAAPEHLACFKEAELVVRVKVTELWMNCPRYIHRYEKKKTSRYVPQVDAETPVCEWKRIDGIQDVLRPNELAQVAAFRRNDRH